MQELWAVLLLLSLFGSDLNLQTPHSSKPLDHISDEDKFLFYLPLHKDLFLLLASLCALPLHLHSNKLIVVPPGAGCITLSPRQLHLVVRRDLLIKAVSWSGVTHSAAAPFAADEEHMSGGLEPFAAELSRRARQEARLEAGARQAGKLWRSQLLLPVVSGWICRDRW